MLKQDYFSVFGLPRKLAIDTAELQRRFYALAREHHPDFHQAAPPEELARVEATSALVNTAYRTLRDPIARVDYLVRPDCDSSTDHCAALRALHCSRRCIDGDAGCFSKEPVHPPGARCAIANCRRTGNGCFERRKVAYSRLELAQVRI